jgi:phage tail sheath protein FI
MINSDIAGAWSLFSSKEASTPNILIGPYDPSTQNTDNVAVANIANSRRDCIAVVGTGAVSATNVTTIVEGKSSSFNSSYVAIYAGSDLISDSYSGKNLYVPKSVFAGALLARNDAVANVWDAPAGLSRGVLPSIGQYKIFNESEIGYLYNYNINTSKRIRGAGDIMWGQKTGQVKQSATDRINVRRLLLYIENTIEPSLLAYMFEANTDKVRSRVKAGLDGFLRTVYAGGGLTAYQVVCDETNNTPQVIDNNTLAIDIYVQPTKTIEYINVQIIITRTGVSFSEII